MFDDIMALLRPLFDAASLEAMSRIIGEDRNSVRRGLEVGVPAAVAGLADYASDEKNAGILIEHVRRSAHEHLDDPTIVAGNPSRVEEMTGEGDTILQRTFADGRLGDLISGIATHAGIGRNGARKLMTIIMPLVLGVIGRRAVTQSMDAKSLRAYLGRQKGIVAPLIPGTVAGAFVHGLHSHTLDTDVREARERVFREVRGGRELVSARHILPWAIAALAAIVVVSLISHANRPRPTVRPPVSQTSQSPITRRQATAPSTAPSNAPSTAPTTPPSTAPQSTTGAIEIGGTSGKDATAISRFLAARPDRSQRFELEDVKFAPGSAALDQHDRTMLDDLAQVLAKDEKADIRIEGHTDATGDAQENQRLSQLRAEAVERYLISKDVDQGRLEAVGVGAQTPQPGAEPRPTVAVVVKPR